MRRRETYNFAEEKPMDVNALDSAVATANLISIMDPKEIGDDEVKLISEATGASEKFVDEMADVCNDACEECAAGKDAEEVKSNFSAAAEAVITKFVESANFSAPTAEEEKDAEDKVLEVAQITALIDDEVLKNANQDELVETIASATQTPGEVVEPIVENAKEQFSNGDTMYLEAEDVANFANEAYNFALSDWAKSKWKATKDLAAKGMLKVKDAGKWVLGKEAELVAKVPGGRKVAYGVPATLAVGYGGYKAYKAKKKNFSEGEEKEAEPVKTTVVAPEVQQETIVPEPTTLPAEGAAKEGVEDTKPAEATAQDPVKESLMDPKEGAKVQDTTAAETALKVQQDLATVESVADVTPAQTNFGRQNLTGKEVTEGLKGLLGARYIPNK